MVDFDERVDDLTFKARALAQAHPLTMTAAVYRDQMVAEERRTQPMSEFADWAGTALLVGYCIRLVPLAHETVRLSDEVRNGRPAGTRLLEPALVEALLDRVISTEIDKRVEHWKGQVSATDWATFEVYIAWWVVHGYALRAAEIMRSVTSPKTVSPASTSPKKS